VLLWRRASAVLQLQANDHIRATRIGENGTKNGDR